MINDDDDSENDDDGGDGDSDDELFEKPSTLSDDISDDTL